MALDKYQIAFWPEYGTLLGAIREGKMIDGDYDIDLATYSDFLLDEFEPVSKELYNLGLFILSTITFKLCYPININNKLLVKTIFLKWSLKRNLALLSR